MQVDVNDGHISGPPGQGPHSVADTGGGADSGVPVHLGAAEEPPIHPRLLAMIVAGRYHGLELDPSEFRGTAGDASPSAASLVQPGRRAPACGRARSGCAGAT